MQIESQKLNLQSLDAPKGREEIIALLEEICAEWNCIHAHMDKILEKRFELV
jgi:hypothetical protein